MSSRAICPATPRLAPLPPEEIIFQYQIDTLIQDGSYSQALQLLDTRRDLVEKTPSLLLKKAELIIRLAQSGTGINRKILETVLPIFEKLCERTTNPEFLVGRCTVLMKIIQSERSIINYQKLKIITIEHDIKETPQNKNGLENQIKIALSKIEQAQKRIEQPLQEAQRIALRLNALAPDTETVKKISKALSLTQLPSLSKPKMTPETFEFLINDYVTSGQHHSAVGLCFNNNILDSNSHLRVKYAYSLLNIQYITEAVQQCNQVLKVELSPYALQCKISCLEKHREWTKAIKVNQLLEKVAPGNQFSKKLSERILRHFTNEIDKLAAKNDWLGAIKTNDQLLKIFPDNDFSKKFRSRLKSKPQALRDQILVLVKARDIDGAKALSRVLKQIESSNAVPAQTRESETQNLPPIPSEEKESGPSTPRSVPKPVVTKYSPPK